jgi:DNA-binding transcriptional ArsR family regulator
MTALAMRQVGLKPAAKVVLYWLADHHNERTGACFPSIARLAELCEMSRRAVEVHLADLEAGGLIRRQPRHRETGGKASNEYILLLAGSDAQNLRIPPAKSAHGVCAKSAHVITMEDTNHGNEPSFALSAQTPDADDLFSAFWNSYPHRNGAKKGKDPARRAWARAVKLMDAQSIIDAAIRSHRDRSVQEGYARDPATWLNQKGWEDEIEQRSEHLHARGANGRGAGGRGSDMVAAFAAVAERAMARDAKRGEGGGGSF